MERGVTELFDSLRPGVEPYFIQSNRIYQRQPPIIREMVRRGFSIQLLPDETDWERLGKPKSFVHLCRMMTATIRTNIAILKAVRGKDVLYVPGISAGFSSMLAALLYRLTGRKVIHHFRDLGTDHRLFPLWLALVTDCVHNTQYGYDDVVRRLPEIKRKRNFVLPHILEVDARPPEDANECRVFEGKKNLFFLGQISYHKGMDILLQSFKLVAGRHRDVRLHLLGECKEDYRCELDREISSAGLGDRVTFWGFREDAMRLLRFAYIYVHTSPPSRFHESFCRSVVEAMALGVPSVCFRSGALQEIVRHEKTGLLCEESPAALAGALNRFLVNPELRATCGEEARRFYEQDYAPSVVRPRWANLLMSKTAKGFRP
jgi:glycosyltransferase involved in cell wall biosynthesis